MEDIQRAITAGNAQSMAAFRHGDAAAVAACYTPEAKLVPPPHPIITGTPGIQAFWHGAMHHRITERALETLDIIARADLAVEVGTYRVTRQSAGGETVTDTGTYTVVWMKEGAQWKMHIDMWNTSPPASDGGRGRVRPRSSPLDHGRACSCLCAVRCTSTLLLPGEPRRLPIALPWPSDREQVAAGQAGRDGHDVEASSGHRTVDFAASHSTICEGMKLIGRSDRRHSLDEHCTRTNWETSMRKLIVAEHMSLDGVMQAPGGPDEDPSGAFRLGGWTVPYVDDAIGQDLQDLFSQPFELLLGRRTYDIFAAYWPRVPVDAASRAIADRFNSVPKHVATHRAETLDWQHSHALKGDLADAIRALKQQDGANLLTWGSADMVRQLLAAGLVDELRLLMYPVVLGRGKRLFGDNAQPSAFTLVHATSTPSGVLLTRYARSGEVRTGAFDEVA